MEDEREELIRLNKALMDNQDRILSSISDLNDLVLKEFQDWLGLAFCTAFYSIDKHKNILSELNTEDLSSWDEPVKNALQHATVSISLKFR